MKKYFLLITICFVINSSFAQLIIIPNGGNKKASISERIGITDVTITYDRPGVKGREGKIWGQLVHEGFTDLHFGTSKAAPWRAGANESTTITFSTDVSIEGKFLPAGKYGFFIAYGPIESTLIFSKNSTAWGSFFYDEKEDALRINVKPVAMDKSVEWLKYEFLNESESTATIAMEWEKLMIPFKVEVDYLTTQLASFRRELQGEKGFTSDAWQQAAQFCVDNRVNLDEGLKWADYAISGEFVGKRNFQTLATKAQLLSLRNRQTEADTIMKEALPLGEMNEVHNYARALLQQKRTRMAFDVFKMNYDNHPNTFTTNMGMARGYSAIGNYTEALKYLNAALPLSPDPPNTSNINGMIEKAKQDKDIN